ncbi:MAG: DUF523 and DUF1722 domain-containing protein [Thermodesulfovibrionales bacterium]|nr:DUF523 and DUF1722 domain-containing protein [Thermodesulfovibrionales bacterium]
MEPIKIGISSCLLGAKVRYDGGHKLDHYIRDTLGKFVTFISVCPEVEMGLQIPREPMRLVGDPNSPRLVTVNTKKDYTNQMLKWASEKVEELKEEKLCGFIFKSRSPSSGMRGVKVYTGSGMPPKTGVGLFAKYFMEQFPLLPVEDEGRLQNPELRENFIERVFVYKRWQDLTEDNWSSKNLISFHTDHKLLILAHSPKHYTQLGKIVSEAGKKDKEELKKEYLFTLMSALKLIATVKKNTNVLYHILGYLKKFLTTDEKKELIDIISNYYKKLIPLIVPITIINHYVRKYNESYLKRQYYLNPHPLELMLRNHV